MGFLINLAISLIIGGICGCAAGKIMNSSGSMQRNVILGVIGGIVGGLVLGILGFRVSNIIGSLISGILGSCIVIWIAQKLS